jgi:excinuclease ABC subunit C
MVDMVFKADSIEWLETDSVLEAMIAEANLIKKHWPDYNVKEKDDRSFNYVLITKEAFPRLLVLRGRSIDVEKERAQIKAKKTFGPFPNGSALREALKIIRRMFPYIDRHSLGKDKYQFYRQIGLTPDTSSEEARVEYQKTINHIILFFEGKKAKLASQLEREMNAYAKAKAFEKAALVKKKLFALDHIQDIALIKEDVQSMNADAATAAADSENGSATARGGFRIEAYDVAHMSGKETVGVMTVVIDGEVTKSEYRKFKLDPKTGNNDVANLREILSRRLNHPEWRMPDLMAIDGGQGQLNVAEKVLAERFTSGGIVVPVVSVLKDDHHKPVDILSATLGQDFIARHKKAILLANNEAHRFAITYHRKLRRISSLITKGRKRM